jgi:CRISPR-associated protein Cas1
MPKSTARHMDARPCTICGAPLPPRNSQTCSPDCRARRKAILGAEEARQPHVRERRRLYNQRLRRARGVQPRVSTDPLPSTLYGPDLRGVAVVGGFGIHVHVADGHLVLGTRDEGELRLPRIASLKRLVIVGTSGSVSLLALWWCREVGAAVVVIDGGGRLLSAVGVEGRDDARLRRAQAMAPWTPAGLTLARELNARKLAGYAHVLLQLGSTVEADAALRILGISEGAIDRARTMAEVRSVEADAGLAYHATLAQFPVSWARGERVPEHWLVMGPRRSGHARGAITPGQAVRNFVGGLTAAEITVACRSIGLDPGLGCGLHDDLRGRNSLVWEVMEAVRPTLDQLTLDVMRSRTWRRGDFHELPSGEVRLRPDWPVLRPHTVSAARSLVAEVSRELLTTLQRTKVVAHTVERVATVIADNAVDTPGSKKITDVMVPTILTNATRRRARRREQMAAASDVASLPMLHVTEPG